MKIDLTAEERQLLWQQLTPLQQQTLTDFKKYRLQSLFLTKNFLADQEWQFFDFKENPSYPFGESNRLYCRCGRELKYQFILKSKTSGELLNLGATHFAQHLSVEPQIARQIQQGLLQLDRGVDIILQSKAQGLRFPKRHYNLFKNHGLIKQAPTQFALRLAAFKAADLPIYDEDIQELIGYLKKAGLALPKLVNNQATPVNSGKNHFRELIFLLQKLEIGEAIETHLLLETLPVTQQELVRWLGFLTGGNFPVQLKQVANTWYRIA
ncbi:hypothetical protein [Enterococcus sp. HY326]|uniref:hypothetical protein n=1 Tax=Enterococcus sp. HY326 TaxID=2971265 RepID=UPI0022409DF7|nr:hypothetical protein [Enterococcus sp. HY326]